MDGSPSQNMWHSFTYSYATFIAISSETDYPGAPEGPDTPFRCGPFGNQLGWLEAQLIEANAERDVRPWLVVSGHRPLYAPDFLPGSVGEMKHLRDAVEDLFLKYKVDIYLSGHGMIILFFLAYHSHY